MASEDIRRAQRMVRKLSEASDNLPSSLFITGVTGREKYPTSGGGFADIYRCRYNNQAVALKQIRQFVRGADVRQMRSVSFNLAFGITFKMTKTGILPRSSCLERFEPPAFITFHRN
jgi:hypothetical protein